jgi:hypothetical protein
MQDRTDPAATDHASTLVSGELSDAPAASICVHYRTIMRDAALHELLAKM